MRPNSREDRVRFLNNAVQELADEQEAQLVSDFDQAEAEYRKEKPPLHVRFRGQDFVLPGTMPFSFSMFFMRYCLKRQGDKLTMEVPDEMVPELIERMFGKAFLSLLEESDVEMGFVLDRMVPDILAKWGPGANTTKADLGNV